MRFNFRISEFQEFAVSDSLRSIVFRGFLKQQNAFKPRLNQHFHHQKVPWVASANQNCLSKTSISEICDKLKFEALLEKRKTWNQKKNEVKNAIDSYIHNGVLPQLLPYPLRIHPTAIFTYQY